MLRGIVSIFIVMLPFCLFSQDTELKLYRPFGENNQLAPIVVKETIAGQCWQQSQRIKRQDAWRCSAQGKIYDPCFIKLYGVYNQAVCPQSPWIGDSVQINLAEEANASQHTELDMSEAYPWALELTTGEKCQAVDEGQTYDGLKVHYQCDSHSVLLGKIQRCKATWSVLQRTTAGVSMVLVTRAWF